ncbi:hypothetical protein [Falsiroseomonas sp. E2-1-a4]|uniref:hypothetical protein n=1 Tax=Falsiroseomonas sp. E2-1-a4 TaxID=3239299 RepID=UPI003F33ABE2
MRDEMTPGLTLPKGGAARLFSLPDIPAFGWCVIVAADPARARLESLARRGALSAFLTHDEGLNWPNRRGEMLAGETLARGGAVALAFATMADALACKRRLEGGPA